MGKKLTTKYFIERAKLVHGEKYNYSEVVYTNSKKKVEIICSKHGSFFQSPTHHMNGTRCPKCALESSSKKLRCSRENFIKKARLVHGDTYDYSKVDYTNSKKKVEIICSKHGTFCQTPAMHSSGRGCSKCGSESTAKILSSSRVDFIKKARLVHGDTYDYSRVDYIQAHKKVKIICSKHGSFTQTPTSHLGGKRCQKCGYELLSKNNTDSRAEFIKKARVVHGDTYNYDDVNYLKSCGDVEIICKTHGTFHQTPNSHLRGRGCTKCGRESISQKKTKSKAHFLSKARLVHGDKYNYDDVSYINCGITVTIGCSEHGTFCQAPSNHYQGSGCPKCGRHGETSGESWIKQILEENDICFIQNDRKVLNGLELDFYIPSLNLAIEFNGLYWHTESKGRGKSYHQNKTKLCSEQGIRLIHIMEDSFVQKKDIVESIIKLAIGKPDEIIYARDCFVGEISPKESLAFQRKTHLYNARGASTHIGLRHKETNELLSVMTFGKSKFNRSFSWELLRYAPKLNTSLKGGAEKSFKFFVETYKPWNILCFADASLFTGSLYENLGFKNEGLTPPNNWYLIDSVRKHRMGFTKPQMIKKGIPVLEGHTAHESMVKAGFDFIWDCGSYKLTWHNQNLI